MNDRDLETRLRDAYCAQAAKADPGALSERVHSIPTTVEPQRRRWWFDLGLGTSRGAGPGGIDVRGAKNMLTATRVAAVVAALTLGASYLGTQVGDPAQPGAPVAAPIEDWTTVTGTQEFTCGYGSCSAMNTMSDPRLSGPVTITWSSLERQAADPANFLLWGAVDATNEGGSWTGHWIGFVDEDELHHTTVWLEGSDGYEGLSYVEQGIQLEPDGPLNMTGLIYEGDIPPTVLPPSNPTSVP